MKIKIQTETKEDRNLRAGGHIVSYYTLDNVIGRALTLIETIGLDEKQEQSVKDLLKQIIRQGVNFHHNTHLSEELYSLIAKFNEQSRKTLDELDGNNIPYEFGSCVTDGEYTLIFDNKK